MTKINYKSDFDFILRLKDGAGHDLGFPDYGWEAMFWTSSKASPFKASCFGGVCKNCYDDEGQIHIVADNHNLGIGTLKVEFRAELPREIYPDDYQRNVMPEPLGIELIREKGELPSEIEAELLLPYIKGEPFTYEDFTPEQIAELQRPATQAAEELKEFQTEAEAKESEREAAETKRISAEELRESAEAQRASAEASRESAEDTRVSHEATRCYSEEARSNNETHRRDFEKERVANEKARVSAEESRAQAETSRVSAEQSRATAETVRQGNETTRSTNEQSRVSAEETRISNEQTRTSAETSRASAEQTRTTNEQSRQQAETARAEAEAQRASEFATWHDEITSKQDALSVSEDLSLSADNELSLTDKAKMQLFIDQWDAAWKVSGTVYGKYDPENAPDAEHPFMGNEIWMTYEEAILVMEYSSGFSAYQNIFLVNIPIKTLLPIPLDYYNTSVDIMSMNELRAIRFIDASAKGHVKIISQQPWFISNCPNLTKIEGTFNISNMAASSCSRFLRGSVNIKEFRASGLNKHLDLETNSKLSLATMQYLVDNASTAITAEKPVVVSVHADVFAKLTGDTTNPAVAALTPAELAQWQQILTAATAKNISFTTP